MSPSNAALALELRGETVYATVPEGFRGPLSWVVGYVRQQLRGAWVDWVAVREAYVYGRTRPFPVGSVRPDAALDEKAKIRFSADGLTAYLILYPPKPRGQRIGEENLHELVQAYGVPAHLVDARAVRSVHLRRSYYEPGRIAEGKPSVNGTPAKVEWRRGLPSDPEGFLSAMEQRGEYPEDILAGVAAGEKIGERLPPAPGAPGISVRGEPLSPLPGEDQIRLDSGLSLDADGRTVIATRPGHLRLTGTGGNRARILPLFWVKDPQQLATGGPIFFPGSVIVEGDFEVPVSVPIRILGDLEVRGGVVRSALDVMGSLFVKDGIIQHRAAPIRAGGVISAAFYERAWVMGRTVHIRRHSLKSRLVARDSVLAPATACVSGGQVAAFRRVAVAVLGSHNAMPTEVAVAVPPTLGGFQEFYKSWIQPEGRANVADEGASEFLSEAALRWREEANQIPAPDVSAATVEAGNVYPGVTVRIGPVSRQIDNALGAADFFYEQVGPKGRISMARRKASPIR